MELVRSEVSANLGAALCNAFLHDIKHLLKPEVKLENILVGKNKLERAKNSIKITGETVADKKTELICIGVDGKTDNKTCTYKQVTSPDGEEYLRKTVQAEHHLTFTFEEGANDEVGEHREGGGYLTHR